MKEEEVTPVINGKKYVVFVLEISPGSLDSVAAGVKKLGGLIVSGIVNQRVFGKASVTVKCLIPEARAFEFGAL